MSEFLPIVTRQDLKTRLHEFLNFDHLADMQPVWSTGTTDEPICVYRNTHDDNRFWRILVENARLQNKKDISVLFLCGLPAANEYTFQFNYQNQIINITRRNIYRTPSIEMFMQTPDIITTSPVGLKYLLKIKPAATMMSTQLFYSTALPLNADLRSEFSVHFSGRLLHTYSTTETGPIAFQCIQNANIYHVFDDVSVEAHTGHILVTKKFRSALPLIRYKTGDTAYVSDHNSICKSCGHRGQNLINLIGRKLPAFSESF